MDGHLMIRSCTEADVDMVLALWARAAAPHSKPDTAGAVLTRLERDRELFLLALTGDEIVGSLIAGWDGWRGHLYRVAVAPGYRRHGIGKQLVVEAERRLVDAGCTRLYASIAVDSDGAAPFWEAVGYGPNVGVIEYAKDLSRG